MDSVIERRSNYKPKHIWVNEDTQKRYETSHKKSVSMQRAPKQNITDGFIADDLDFVFEKV